MNEILNFLHETKIFYLATVEGDKPKVRPFGLAMTPFYIKNGKETFCSMTDAPRTLKF